MCGVARSPGEKWGTGPMNHLSMELVASPDIRYSFTSKISCRDTWVVASGELSRPVSVFFGVLRNHSNVDQNTYRISEIA